MLSARVPIAIYGALIRLKETSSQDNKARIINVFQASSPRRASHLMGENTISELFHFPQMMPCVPVIFARLNAEWA